MSKKNKPANPSIGDLKATMRAMALFRGVSLINEQLEAQPPAPTGDAMATPPPPAPAPTGDATAPPPPPSDGTPGQITAESLVEVLNEIRAGKSFDDPAVYTAFTTYFNATPESTRSMLDTELRKVAELVRPQNAAQPENAPPAAAPATPGVTPPPPTPAQTSPGVPPVPTI